MIEPPIIPGIMIESAGKTFNYFSGDSEDRYHHHQKKFRDQLIEYNWYDINIDYHFNSHGFRSDEFDANQEHFLVLGCSITFGEGLHEYQTWARMVSDCVKMPYYNLGIPGISNMGMFRMANYWIPKLKPKFVIFQMTFEHRFELLSCDQRETTNNYAPMSTDLDPGTEDFLRRWWSHNENSMYDKMRNELAVKQICAEQGIPCYIIGVDQFRPQLDLARDLTHPGYKTHQRVARQVLEMIK